MFNVYNPNIDPTILSKISTPDIFGGIQQGMKLRDLMDQRHQQRALADWNGDMNDEEGVKGAARALFAQGKTAEAQSLYDKFRENKVTTTKTTLAKQNDMTTTAGRQAYAKGLGAAGYGEEAGKLSQDEEVWLNQMETARNTGLARAAAEIRLLPPDQRVDAWKKKKQLLANRVGLDMTDTPDNPDDHYLESMEVLAYPPEERRKYFDRKEADAQDLEWLKQETTYADKMAKAAGSQGDRTKILAEIQSKYPKSPEAQWFMEKTHAESPFMMTGPTQWTDNGLVRVGPDGTARPIVTPGPGGKQVQPKLEPPPATINTGYAQNAVSLQKIDRALALLNQYKDAVGYVKGQASSTDLGATVLNKTDPKGIEARAAIADIGSLLLHDRSGAAVTVSEAPRLIPFVPRVVDGYEKNKKNLEALRQVYLDQNNEIENLYPSLKTKRRPAAAAGSSGGGSGASGNWSYGQGGGEPGAAPVKRNWSYGGSSK